MKKTLAILLGASMILGLAACKKVEPPSEKDLQEKLEEEFDGEFELEDDDIADDKSEAEYVFISDDGMRQVTVNWNAKDPDDLEFEEKSLIDGTWEAEFDLTGILENSFDSDDVLDGEIYMYFTLNMDDGDYEISLDSDKFTSDFTSFIENNIDNLMYEALGTSDPDELEEYAVLLGYDDYQALVDDMLSSMMETAFTEDFEVSDNGTYTIDGTTITFDSDNGDPFDGEYDDGKILLSIDDEMDMAGGEKLDLVFEKAD